MKVYYIIVFNLETKKEKYKVWVTGKRRVKKIAKTMRGVFKKHSIKIVEVKKEIKCKDEWIKSYPYF